MRITQSMIARNTLKDLQNSSNSLVDVQQKLSSGKQIENPSDDPAGMVSVLSYRGEISGQSQYGKDMTSCSAWMTSTSTALQSMESSLLSIEDLSSQANTDILTAAQKKSIGEEINQYLEELVDTTNETSSGKSLFSGLNTGTSAFSATRDSDGKITAVTQNADVSGSNAAMLRKIGKNQSVTINVTGVSLMQPDGAGASTDIFATLVSLRDALYSGDSSTAKAATQSISDAYDRVVAADSKIGSVINRVTSSQTRLTTNKTQLTESLSNVEDADYTETSTEYYQKKSAYDAALQVSAQIVQMTLLKYM